MKLKIYNIFIITLWLIIPAQWIMAAIIGFIPSFGYVDENVYVIIIVGTINIYALIMVYLFSRIAEKPLMALLTILFLVIPIVNIFINISLFKSVRNELRIMGCDSHKFGLMKCVKHPTR